MPALAVLLGTVVSFTVAEVAVRVLSPMPRTQVVRPSQEREIHTLEGVTMWTNIAPGWDLLPADDCVADRHISFVGDSILQVTGATAEENFVGDLRARMGDQWCVHNVAQAGFVAQQKAALARDQIQRFAPDYLIWEVWGERGSVVLLGDVAYGVGGYETDALGTPIIPGLPLPLSVNRWLFGLSRLWEYAVLALGATEEFDDVVPLFEEVVQQADASGTQVVLVFFPELERPFGEPSPVVNEVQEQLKAYASQRGLETLDVGDAWQGKVDYEQVRLDPCCHYNPDGHRELAGLFEELIADLEARRQPADRH